MLPLPSARNDALWMENTTNKHPTNARTRLLGRWRVEETCKALTLTLFICTALFIQKVTQSYCLKGCLKEKQRKRFLPVLILVASYASLCQFLFHTSLFLKACSQSLCLMHMQTDANFPLHPNSPTLLFIYQCHSRDLAEREGVGCSKNKNGELLKVSKSCTLCPGAGLPINAFTQKKWNWLAMW